MRPYLGVAYRMISRELSVLNEVPEGAYVQQVIDDSSAAKAGIEVGDIITRFDGKKIDQGNGGLAEVIGKKKVGDTVTITVWRDGKTIELKAKLETAPDQ